MAMTDYQLPVCGPDSSAPAGLDASDPILSMRGIIKRFGTTLANADIDLQVRAGDIVGLVGGNGAGKSTLMRILCGGTPPDSGSIAVAGVEIDTGHYGPAEAQRLGIRMVHQELSLCSNLSVAENFYLESPDHTPITPNWREAHRKRARAALDAVFPGAGIDVNAKVGHLTIGERQMVEIARAAANTDLRLIVLDEPTSSLDQERSHQLRAFIRAKSETGTAFIFISHKLQEVIDIATHVVVMRNGGSVWHGEALNASIGQLVQLMGGNVDALKSHRKPSVTGPSDVAVRISGALTELLGHDVDIRKGEIVGLAGLEGSGQKDLLHAVFAPGRAGHKGVSRLGKAAFIAGDRTKEGVFSLWNVLDTMSIGRIAARNPLALVSDRIEREAAIKPAAQLRLDEARFASGILELSGGNQQKALVARALMSDCPILLLDDPTRGVDIATKQDFYRLCGEIAQEGKALIWLSTEDAELLTADRVLVFCEGRIVKELCGKEISEEAIVAASFSHQAHGSAKQVAAKSGAGRLGRSLMASAPFIGLVAVLATMMLVNPRVASVFGLDLLLMPALSLVLVAMAQMFVIGGSEIDLGVGAFAGLVSVLSATLLYDNPPMGIAAIAAAIALYAALGATIQARRIPAIVVTLGASFIWGGIGYSLQPTPGGSSPEWLSAMVNWSFDGLPTSVILICLIGLVAALIDRMPLGVTLRGFGNNPAAMTRSGWGSVRYAWIRYGLSGLFGAVAGLSLTAINTASDINSGNSFTLLSVAAVVMGGSSLIGGYISPAGVVAGAVTLSLIGALLGVLDVSSDFNAASQGFVLIALLVLRSLMADRRDEQ
ncbi:MAG: ATP-binding cassette domain-containing protein [Ancalomicrobiaceae bacterium]|nr:ATP-binding cassette domain-containing protein [Ancalomicrobiaceae bacterium]